MTFEQACRVLGIPVTASDARAKTAYRALARRFHPDVNPAPGAAARFVEIATAYECFRTQAAERASTWDPEEEAAGSDDELGARIAAIHAAFDRLRAQASSWVAQAQWAANVALADRLMRYRSAREVRRRIGWDFQATVHAKHRELVEQLDAEIGGICREYEDWIGRMVRETCESLRVRVRARYHWSVGFWIMLAGAAAFAVGAGVFLALPLAAVLPVSLALGFVSARGLQLRWIDRTYDPDRVIIRLDREGLRIDPQMLVIDTRGGWTEDETGTVGALAGAGVGFWLGGPGGALVGAIAGGIAGAMFGETLDEARQAMAARLEEALLEVFRRTGDRVDSEIRRIEQRLVEVVRENFERNRQMAVRLVRAAPLPALPRVSVARAEHA